jgi:hypothetical protein
VPAALLTPEFVAWLETTHGLISPDNCVAFGHFYTGDAPLPPAVVANPGAAIAAHNAVVVAILAGRREAPPPWLPLQADSVRSFLRANSAPSVYRAVMAQLGLLLPDIRSDCVAPTAGPFHALLIAAQQQQQQQMQQQQQVQMQMQQQMQMQGGGGSGTTPQQTTSRGSAGALGWLQAAASNGVFAATAAAAAAATSPGPLYSPSAGGPQQQQPAKVATPRLVPRTPGSLSRKRSSSTANAPAHFNFDAAAAAAVAAVHNDGNGINATGNGSAGTNTGAAGDDDANRASFTSVTSSGSSHLPPLDPYSAAGAALDALGGAVPCSPMVRHRSDSASGAPPSLMPPRDAGTPGPGARGGAAAVPCLSRRQVLAVERAVRAACPFDYDLVVEGVSFAAMVHLITGDDTDF